VFAQCHEEEGTFFELSIPATAVLLEDTRDAQIPPARLRNRRAQYARCTHQEEEDAWDGDQKKWMKDCSAMKDLEGVQFNDDEEYWSGVLVCSFPCGILRLRVLAGRGNVGALVTEVHARKPRSLQKANKR